MPPPTPHCPAFVHVDLDGLWTLAGCYGYPEGDSYARDPVFEGGLERLLGLLEELGLRATFFIVGRDLEHPAKAAAVREVAKRGHELASHGWSHRFGLEGLAEEELNEEIARTSREIEAAAGVKPIGFRAPGYAAGPRVLTALSRAGLRYDGSTLPTRAAPLLRWLAGRLRARVRREMARKKDEGKREKNGLGPVGTLEGSPPASAASPYSTTTGPEPWATGALGATAQGQAFRFTSETLPGQPINDIIDPNHGSVNEKELFSTFVGQYGGGGPTEPEWFEPAGGGAPVLRLPLAVSPLLRLPLHASLGMMLGRGYVRAGLRGLARRGQPITWLLHGMDALGFEDLRGRLPAALLETRPFQTPLEAKLDFLRAVLSDLKEMARVELTCEWLERNYPNGKKI